MNTSHTQAYVRLLESISYYSGKSIDILQDSAGDLPQWASDILSSTRTHMKDVTHFLRGQADHGIRYGSHNNGHGRAYIAWKNLREIVNYADEALSYIKKDAGLLPAWTENKISICAEYMDLVGHWLENEKIEARRYGSFLYPTQGDAGDEALYRGRADGLSGVHKNPYSPNDFRNKIYEQGFSEGYGGGSYDRMAHVTMMSSGMEYMLHPSRMLEPHRMTELHKQLAHQTGRRFGVPGFVAGQPGWAGHAGVAQMHHPSRRTGIRYSRAGNDPRGHWGAGVPASAGFIPEAPVILNQSKLPLEPLAKNQFKLSRQSARRTRGALRQRMKR